MGFGKDFFFFGRGLCWLVLFEFGVLPTAFSILLLCFVIIKEVSPTLPMEGKKKRKESLLQ